MRVDHLVTGARKASGLTVRRLAELGDVAATTITRVQRGAVDPSIETLSRIIGAAGYELSLVVQRRRDTRAARLGDLVDAWSRRGEQVELDWTRWRAFLDELSREPDHVPEAIYIPPWPSGEPVIDALLASVAEKLADDNELPRPSWTELVPPPAEPYIPLVVRRVDGREVPPQLAARSLIIDGESLWRDRTTIGV